MSTFEISIYFENSFDLHENENENQQINKRIEWKLEWFFENASKIRQPTQTKWNIVGFLAKYQFFYDVENFFIFKRRNNYQIIAH